MHRRSFFLTALIVFVIGCASLAPPSLRALSMTRTASVDDYAPYLKEGTATLTGQAFLSTRGGDVKKAAGRPVTLDPVTPYALEWYAQIGTNTDRFSDAPPDTLFRQARHVTTADADGKFRFANLPEGRYILRTTVTWEAPTGYRYSLQTQGGVVSEIVDLKNGESKEVIMSSMSR